MEQRWDPGIKKFFVKILNTIALGLCWMIASAVGGLYFELGYTNGKPVLYTVLFYIAMIGSLIFLIRYLYRIWKTAN